MLRHSGRLRFLKVAAILAVGTCSAIFVAYPNQRKSPPLGNAPQVQFPSQNLAPTAAKQFLDGSFSLINDVRNLPAPVLRAFTEQGGSRTLMANPGKAFRVGDVVDDPTVPSKHLIFAGISGDRCFVHYERWNRPLLRCGFVQGQFQRLHKTNLARLL